MAGIPEPASALQYGQRLAESSGVVHERTVVQRFRLVAGFHRIPSLPSFSDELSNCGDWRRLERALGEIPERDASIAESHVRESGRGSGSSSVALGASRRE